MKTALPVRQLGFPSLDKRWKNGTERFVVPANVFDPTRYRVDTVSHRDAKAMVLKEHYSGSWVAARFTFGMYCDRELVGVAVFSVPMSQAVLRAHLAVEPHEGIELGRFVMTPEVGFNGESFFLARALRYLKQADSKIQKVLSFADPLERRNTLSGELTKAAHHGCIYKATNAERLGRSSPRWLHVLPNGNVVSPRTLSKIRNEEQGRAYAEALLTRGGIDPRRPFESGRAWLDRTVPTMLRVHHPGNYAFGFTLRDRRPAA